MPCFDGGPSGGGDRVYMTYGAMCGEDSGTAEDRGGYYVAREHAGIGTYLVTVNAPDPEHVCISEPTRDGAYCKACGETLA